MPKLFNCAGCGREGVKGIYCPDCRNSKGRRMAHLLKLRQLNLFDRDWSRETFEVPTAAESGIISME